MPGIHDHLFIITTLLTRDDVIIAAYVTPSLPPRRLPSPPLFQPVMQQRPNLRLGRRLFIVVQADHAKVGMITQKVERTNGVERLFQRCKV